PNGFRLTMKYASHDSPPVMLLMMEVPTRGAGPGSGAAPIFAVHCEPRHNRETADDTVRGRPGCALGSGLIKFHNFTAVIPAQAGIHPSACSWRLPWTPDCAGVTMINIEAVEFFMGLNPSTTARE